MAVYDVGVPCLQKQGNSVIIFVFFQRQALRVIGIGLVVVTAYCLGVYAKGLYAHRGSGEAMKRESLIC